MNKKELRKELELLLIKSIEEVLSKKNTSVPSKIRKTTYEASKSIAKKFYKALKISTTKSVHSKAKKAIKVVALSKKGTSVKTKTPVKSIVKKAKPKSKK